MRVRFIIPGVVWVIALAAVFTAYVHPEPVTSVGDSRAAIRCLSTPAPLLAFKNRGPATGHLWYTQPAADRTPPLLAGNPVVVATGFPAGYCFETTPPSDRAPPLA